MLAYRPLWLLSAATSLAATHCATAENQLSIDQTRDGSVAMGGTGNVAPGVTGGFPPVTTGGQPPTGGGGTTPAGDDCSAPNLKRCSGICVSPAPGVGCDLLTCDPCPSVVNGTSICTGTSCDVQCNSGYVKSGTSCVAGSGTGGTTGTGGSTSADPCFDGIKNGTESDIDCGGACAGCGAGRYCNTNADCDSRVCTEGRFLGFLPDPNANACEAPACDDNILNGNESDTDCGGTCPTSCADGERCNSPADCQSGGCDNGICSPPCGGDAGPCASPDAGSGGAGGTGGTSCEGGPDVCAP